MLIHSATITGSVQLNNTDVSSITGVAGFATTGSNQFNGNQSISGSITSNGTITAQTLVVQTVTSSVDFITGSARFGSLSTNTHQFTGSVLVTGSTISTQMGVGVSSLSAWGSPFSVTQYPYGSYSGGTTSGAWVAGNNNYYDGTNYKYTLNDYASLVTQGGGDFYIRTATTGTAGATITWSEKFRVTNGGNVGIGVTNPAVKLQIDGSLTLKSNSNQTIQLWNSGSVAANLGGNLEFRGTYRNSDNDSVIYSKIFGGKENASDGNFAGYLSISTYEYPNSLAERVRINSSGNVGIGTASPSKNLHVFATNGNGIGIGQNSTSTQLSANLFLYPSDNTSSKRNWAVTTYYDRPELLQFRRSSTTTSDPYDNGVTLMTLDGINDRVGIGTISPSAKLHVNGGLRLQNGSTDLNYYEEGSWTPLLSGNSGTQNFTMSGINAGKYIRIGNQVTVSANINWSSNGGYTGDLRIYGLPFASSGVRSAGSIGAVGSGISFSSGFGQWILVNDPTVTWIYVIQQESDGSGYNHNPVVAGSGVIYGLTLTYFIL